MGLWKGRRPRALTLEVFGVRVALDIADPELEVAVAEMLPAGWQLGRAGDATGRFGLTRSSLAGFHVSADGTPGSDHATLEMALGLLQTSIEQYIAASAREWLFIHAGAVSRDGRALVIPGESFSGKTTLVAALVEAGATYYSDEFAVLDRDGRLHAYPRRLSLRTLDGQRGQQLHARDLGGVEAIKESAEVGAVVFTHYRPNATWRPKQMTPAQTVAALFASTLGAHDRAAESMHTLGRAIAGATALEGERGEAATTAAALLEMLGARDGW